MSAVSPASPWLPRWQARHGAAMLAVTVAVALLAAPFARAPLGLQVAVLAAGVALLGVPHGALDPLVGRALLAPRLGRAWAPAFHAGYLALAGVVLLAWRLAPVATLAAFLALSAVHFGLGDVAPAGAGRGARVLRAGEVLARGALPIAVPVAAHRVDVARLFGWLVPPGAAPAAAALAWDVAAATPVLLAPALGAVVLGHALAAWRADDDAPARRAHLGVVAEVAALALVGVVAPPLVAFLVYFCGWHALRHTLHLAAWLEPTRPARALGRFVRLGAWATALTLAAGAAAWLAWRPAAGDAPAAVRALFVGLSALTLPHMALTAWAGEDAPDAPR